MCKIRFILFLIFAMSFGAIAGAQILDDEPPAQDYDTSYSNKDDDTETLFNEMFSEHLEAQKESEQSSSFDKTSSLIADKIKESDKTLERKNSKQQYEPLEGEILIGVTKGSYKVFRSMTGRTKCSFGVTAKSNIDRDIKTMALRLVWQKRAFAFIFDGIPANGAVERFISTTGDFCYDLSGVPDIDINLCKIKNARGDECAKRIKWDANLESPDPSASPY